MKQAFLLIAILMMGTVCVTMTSCGDDEPTPAQQQGGNGENKGDSTENNYPVNDSTLINDSTVVNDTREYVDLGLPSGTLWATCNVGADNPEGYGDYFAWGETVPYGKEDRSNTHNYASTGSYTKTAFSWDSYKYSTGPYTQTKYCTNSDYGTVDNKTELDVEDDAAYANWGSGWRMPSKTQFGELTDSSYTTITWTKQNGINGRLITSRSNGNSIFLPAAGTRGASRIELVGSFGGYWSRTLYISSQDLAHGLYFNSEFVSWEYIFGRCNGRSVRPVRVSK